jgi:hypothetical protein
MKCISAVPRGKKVMKPTLPQHNTLTPALALKSRDNLGETIKALTDSHTSLLLRGDMVVLLLLLRESRTFGRHAAFFFRVTAALSFASRFLGCGWRLCGGGGGGIGAGVDGGGGGGRDGRALPFSGRGLWWWWRRWRRDVSGLRCLWMFSVAAMWGQ